MTTVEAKPPPRPALINPQLLTEALGFSPQLLLDDIINVANQTVQDGVNGVEDFLRKRADDMHQDEMINEIEQGLVAFQTLLEFHTDVAFDFFEAWSLRNIFAVPADLPLVMPHNQSLDLTHTSEEVQQILDEIQQMRTEIFKERKLHQELVRANRRRKVETQRMRNILSELAPYETIDAQTLPEALLELQKVASSLPELQPATISALTQLGDTEEGARQWEMGRTGYFKWATAQLLAKSSSSGEDFLPEIANVEKCIEVSNALDKVSRGLASAGVDTTVMVDDA
ncbi:Mis12-domain-containing protein [Mycena indigotica]|uniref:Mis12-domain-containing protein n=1 Tax=Mycena indigotica TaxID=2126181 RepID=A0A8H6WA98_9AGAR|nr:Mis12-domain-containing protein [Mycena indigotica]KAF7307413.1 Mis12-domain-containing protein [Mycena indigotica]